MQRILTVVLVWLGVAACGDNIKPATTTLTSLEVTAANSSLPLGRMTQITAVAVFSDGSRGDVTSDAEWVSSSTQVATVSPSGQARGVGRGSADITATYSENGKTVTGSVTLAVVDAKLESIEVTPPSLSIARGTSGQLTATGIFSDQTTMDLTASASWTSADAGVVTVAAGTVVGVDVGTVTVTATQDGVSGSASVEVTAVTLVSIEVTPTQPSLAKGTSLQLTATGVFSDNSRQDLTTQVTWGSDMTGVATVNGGLVEAVDVGTATITADLGGVTGQTAVTVTAATLQSIEVSPADPTVHKGTSQQMTATGVYSDSSTQDLTNSVDWSSDTPAVATVSASGSVDGVAVGTATITATDSASGISGSTVVTVDVAVLTSIQVTPADSSVAGGTAVQFVAEGTFSDLSTATLTASVTWSSDMTSVASISNASGTEGYAVAGTPGTATITATDPTTGISGSTTLTVTGATLVRIDVDPPAETLPRGTGETYTAIGVYSDFTTQDLTTSVTWASSNTAAATISNAAGTEGNATTLAQGTTFITATDTSTGIVGTAKLIVGRSVLLSMVILPADPTIAKGARLQFQCIGTYDDGTTRDITQFVTWTSSKPGTASVSNAPKKHGLAQGKIAGVATITATDPATGLFATTTLTVTDATLVSIDISPLAQSIPSRTHIQFTATGHYSDGTTSDFTSSVSWSSSLTTVATISNQNFAWGFATAVGPGTTTITALDTTSGVSTSTTLTVTNATLVSLAITPASPNAIVNVPLQLTATGTFSDGTTMNLTQDVTWTSSDTNIATILNVGSTKGTLTGQAAGNVTITANYPQSVVSGSDAVTVIP